MLMYQRKQNPILSSKYDKKAYYAIERSSSRGAMISICMFYTFNSADWYCRNSRGLGRFTEIVPWNVLRLRVKKYRINQLALNFYV